MLIFRKDYFKAKKLYNYNILIFLLTLIYFNFLDKNKTIIAICVIAKQENRYIKEFVNYYRKLKKTKIYLYVNKELNGENFEDILSKYINS